MINPNDVNLIIFDMDGTIVPSVPAVYESIKRAFVRLGWLVNFNAEDISRFFGVSTASTTGSMYEFITPPGSPLTAEEVREKVRAEYAETFRETAQPYPDVKETLKTLRKRGYKLAQYTNASVMYLNLIMESLDIRQCFDYVECIQENKLDKIALARKIIDKFGATAAIVGDRSHDIEAARANDSLSIGALYGYGESEPEQADITINSFDRLLSIFDRRRPVFEKMLTEIEGKRGAGRPFVVGINGIDCSGKTLFAGAFEEYLVEKGCHTQLISLDDFLNPAQIRYAGNNRDELYYERVKQGYTFNFTWLVKTLLKPAREKGELTASLVSKTGIYDMVKEFNFTPDTIIILEGVFLFIDELAPYIDYKIYLDVPFETCRERARARDPEEVFNKYEKKYLPAQQKYLDEFPPDKTADMVIDNSNWEYPQIRFIK